MPAKPIFPLVKTKIWKVTIAYFGEAVAKGVTPFPFISFAHAGQNEGAYREHHFYFNTPPSRADFLAYIRILPWASVWDKDFRPLLEDPNQQWPIVERYCKSADVDILNASGQRVGYVRVRWEDLIQVNRYAQLWIHTIQNAVVDKFRKENRQAADMAIMGRSNWILEQAMLNAESDDREVDDQDIEHFIGEVLVKAGIWTKNRFPLLRLTEEKGVGA